MYSIELNIVSTLILAIFLYLLGNYLISKVKILNKLCIPAPVLGGLLFSILSFSLKYFDLLHISMNTLLMPYFMSFFFTIVGINVSFSFLKKGGKTLFIYWILCAFIGFSQNTLALIMSNFISINPLLSLMCGSISMEGGHGYSLAFGCTIESMGVSNACSVGIASSTLGLIIGGLIGGPIGKHLIEKNKLKYNSNTNISNNISSKKYNFTLKINTTLFFEQILIVLLCMSVGNILAKFLNINFNLIIPNIVGCIFVAVIVRNFNDKAKILEIDFNLLNFLQELSLGMFLSMALMSIDFFTLSNLFGPIILIVLSQVVFLILFSVFVGFKVLGKDYDAAVMISGLLGHGLGATPNALANMGTITQKYGFSETAYLIVPLVAGFLLDIFSIPCILFFINILT